MHSTGGWLALVGATILGPRIGKFNKDGSANAIPGHSLPMAGLGVFILWLGWFGFNPGSTMAVSGGVFFQRGAHRHHDQHRGCHWLYHGDDYFVDAL